MVDSFTSFSNKNSMDFFPSFKNFHEPNNDQGAFTIDKKDIDEIQNNISLKPIEKPKRTKRNNNTSNNTKETNSNSIAQCDICFVPISGPIVHDSHTKGKKHQTQLKAVLAKNPQYKPPTYEELCSKKPEPIIVNNQNEKSEISLLQSVVNEKTTIPPLIPTKTLNCNMCNVSCNSQHMYDNHIAGKKHQMKLKLTNLTNSAPTRTVPDNNPSSSNYCDVCSIKLNSEDELTEHLAQKRHQTRVKEAEFCAKEAVDMNINFDSYKISTTDTEKNTFDYQCTPCNKKFRNKMQLISHLKSAFHNQHTNRSNNQDSSKKPIHGNHHTTRGGTTRGSATTRNQNVSSFRGSIKPARKSRPYQPQNSSWNQSFNQQSNEQTLNNNPFGAFDPTNQLTYSSDNNNYYSSSTKRSTQYEENSNAYDGFYPKRIRTYNNDNTQNYYPTDKNYYPPSSSSQPNNHSVAPQPPWQYQTEPHYDQQQYSNTKSDYMNTMHYPSNQPPLPNYEPPPPPLPNYPPPSSSSLSSSSTNIHYPQNSPFFNDNNFYQNSFRH